MAPKDRVGPELVLVVSVAVGALVAAVEVNDPKFRPGTSGTGKRRRQTFYNRDTVASTDQATVTLEATKV